MRWDDELVLRLDDDDDEPELCVQLLERCTQLSTTTAWGAGPCEERVVAESSLPLGKQRHHKTLFHHARSVTLRLAPVAPAVDARQPQGLLGSWLSGAEAAPHSVSADSSLQISLLALRPRGLQRALVRAGRAAARCEQLALDLRSAQQELGLVRGERDALLRRFVPPEPAAQEELKPTTPPPAPLTSPPSRVAAARAAYEDDVPDSSKSRRVSSEFSSPPQRRCEKSPSPKGRNLPQWPPARPVDDAAAANAASDAQSPRAHRRSHSSESGLSLSKSKYTSEEGGLSKSEQHKSEEHLSHLARAVPAQQQTAPAPAENNLSNFMRAVPAQQTAPVAKGNSLSNFMRAVPAKQTATCTAAEPPRKANKLAAFLQAHPN